MTSAKRRAIMISVALGFPLAASSALAETYLVHIAAEIDQTTVPDGGTLPVQYSVGKTMTGVFEIESRRTRHIKAARSEGRGAMRFTRTPKKLSFDGPTPLSYRNGRLLVTADGAARWGNADDYCKGYAATRNLFCSASGSIEVSQSAAGGTKQSGTKRYSATNFSFSLPAGMDPKLALQPALEKLVSLASNGDSKLVLGFSDKKGRADQDQVKLMLSVTSMEFKTK